jgi:predicted secreted protein
MALVGKKGSISWSSDQVAEMGEFSFDVAVDTEETTSFGSDWKTYLGTLASWTGRCQGRFSGSDAAQKAMRAALPTGEPATVTGTLTTGVVVSGEAILTAMNISAPVGGVITVSFDMQGSGPITLPT